MKNTNGLAAMAASKTDATKSAAESKPVRRLECCVCGESTRGRQWWNRDTGYGICPPCVEFVRGKGETEEQIHSYYGVAGVHYAVEVS